MKNEGCQNFLFDSLGFCAQNLPKAQNSILQKRLHYVVLLQLVNMAYAQMVEPDAYVYYFDRKLPGDDAGAFHSAELWYVFGSLKYCWRPLEEADFALSRKMITYWSSFMKSGDPNGGDGGPWRPCTKAEPYFEVLK